MSNRAVKVQVYSIGTFLSVAMWIAGFVIAKGFWSTLACIIPFWAWYITIEHVLSKLGWL